MVCPIIYRGSTILLVVQLAAVSRKRRPGVWSPKVSPKRSKGDPLTPKLKPMNYKTQLCSTSAGETQELAESHQKLSKKTWNFNFQQVVWFLCDTVGYVEISCFLLWHRYVIASNIFYVIAPVHGISTWTNLKHTKKKTAELRSVDPTHSCGVHDSHRLAHWVCGYLPPWEMVDLSSSLCGSLPWIQHVKWWIFPMRNGGSYTMDST